MEWDERDVAQALRVRRVSSAGRAGTGDRVRRRGKPQIPAGGVSGHRIGREERGGRDSDRHLHAEFGELEQFEFK
jgi:hypothetical protein